MPAPASPPIDLLLGQSATGWRLALFVHTLAAIAPLFSAGGLYMMGLWPLFAVSLWCSYRRFILSPADPVGGIRFHNHKWLLLQSTNPDLVNSTQKQWQPCELYGEQLVMPFLTILTFRFSRREQYSRLHQFFSVIRPPTISVIIFGDAVAKEPYRQLRVLLRH